jgi:hypothetical protein
MSDKPHIQTAETDGISHWYFPAPIPDKQTSDKRKYKIDNRFFAILFCPGEP